MRYIKYLLIFFGFCSTALAGPLNISNVPLELTPSVPANVFILTDDSGSMDWEVLTQNPDNSGAFCSANVDGSCVVADITHRVPETGGPPSCQPYIDPLTSTANGDFISGYLYIVAFNSNEFKPMDLAAPANDPFIRNCFVARDEEFRVRNSTYNPLYFDPNKTYIPWAGVDINGNPYADVDVTNAPDNPYNPQEFINLTSHESGLDISGNRISGNGFAYYDWNDDGDGVFEDGEQIENLVSAQDAATQQNFANWFSYYRKREYVAKALTTHAVAGNTASRIGFATINQNVSPGLRVALQNLSTSTGNKRTLLDAIASANSLGATPLRQAYEKVGEYFECSAGDIFNSTSSSNPGDADCPALIAPGGTCQTNTGFIFSDGFYNGPDPSVGNEDQDDLSSDFDGGAFADSFSNTLADVAIFYHENDLQPLLDNNVPATSVDFIRDPNTPAALLAGDTLQQHLNTNVVSIFNNLNMIIDPSFPGDAKTSFSWLDPATFPGVIDDLRHAAYNGRGNFITATGEKDFPSIMNELDSAFTRAASNTGSTTAMAFNTQSIREDTLVFRTFSNLANNSGELVAQRVNFDGSFNEDSNGNPIFEWSAATQVNTQAPNTRNIFSFDPAADQGIEFVLGNLTAAQITALENPVPAAPVNPIVQTRIDYLRGDSSNEGTNFDGGEMRVRSALSTVNGITTGGKIGDIVHSSPVFVGDPPFVNRTGGAFPSGSGDTYAEFRAANQNREQFVYVGANDGMLHSFYVNDTPSADPGDERFAYIPDVLFNEIGNYTDPNYVHQFYVDLTPSVNDVYIDPVTGGSQQWRTVLVNGLGAGGKGYFALDITNPTSIDEDNVMWEFTDNDDADLGFSFSQPVIAMSNAPSTGDKEWVAIFGNGFNSTSANGNAIIYVLFLDNDYNGWSPGSDFIKIDTGVGKSTSADGTTPNGISGITVIDTDGNGTADRAYAGDLQGNVYIIDLTSTNPSSWNIERTLFTATYESGSPIVSTPQPITTRPTVIANPSGGFVVIVGTGSYFTTDDAISTEIQSIYGLWDNPTGNTSTITKYSSPSQLVEQNFITTVDNDSGLVVRTVSNNPVLYNDSGANQVRGWFIDFDIPPPGSTTGVQFPGERPVRSLQLRTSQLFFNTVIPQDGTSCAPPAGGFGLSVDALTGGVGINVIFDINIDGVFDLNDNLNGVNNLANVIVGTQFESAPSDNNFIGDYRVTQLANGSVDRILINPALNNGVLLGRHSWKEILN